ncbi:MAG: hypothetical protein ACRD5H_13095 [Nitrososphaerales archaeon]
MDKLVTSVLDANDAEYSKTFHETIIPFAFRCMSLNTIVLVSVENDIQKLSELEQTLFEELLKTINNSSGQVGIDTARKIIDIIERFADYENVLLGIAKHRPEQLIEAFKQADLDDFLKSVYGTLLALSCILLLIKENKPDAKKLAILLELAIPYSEKLESYADTIDILTNPEEMELLKRSEGE